MSGGAYDYVYRALIMGDIESVVEGRWKLEEIAEGLAAHGYPEAVAPVAAICARIAALDAWSQGLARDGLPELLKAFEWWQSGDTNEGHFREDLDKYLFGRDGSGEESES